MLHSVKKMSSLMIDKMEDISGLLLYCVYYWNVIVHICMDCATMIMHGNGDG